MCQTRRQQVAGDVVVIGRGGRGLRGRRIGVTGPTGDDPPAWAHGPEAGNKWSSSQRRNARGRVGLHNAHESLFSMAVIFSPVNVLSWPLGSVPRPASRESWPRPPLILTTLRNRAESP